MGNHKLRQEVAALMKKRGYGRLYRGRRRVARHFLPAWVLRDLLHCCRWTVGDLVNDCDGFNHRIVRPILWWSNPEDGEVFQLAQFELENGRWSCGCHNSPEEPWTVEAIEAFQRLTEEQCAFAKASGGWSPRHQWIQERLAAGEPICDEEGKPLWKQGEEP